MQHHIWGNYEPMKNLKKQSESVDLVFHHLPMFHLRCPSGSFQTGLKASLEMDRQMGEKKVRRLRETYRRRRGRCDPLCRAYSIYRSNCPNWWATGRATALHWCPTPSPSPRQPFHLAVLCSPLLPHSSCIQSENLIALSCAISASYTSLINDLLLILPFPFHPSSFTALTLPCPLLSFTSSSVIVGCIIKVLIVFHILRNWSVPP